MVEQQPTGHQNRDLGQRGEDVAAEFLRNTGVIVLERNWRCREGELDILGMAGRTLVVCEVKTRSGVGYGVPAEAVTGAKAARIRRLATRWLSENRTRWVDAVRFDVVAVLWPPGGDPEITHIPEAF